MREEFEALGLLRNINRKGLIGRIILHRTFEDTKVFEKEATRLGYQAIVLKKISLRSANIVVTLGDSPSYTLFFLVGKLNPKSPCMDGT